MRNTILAAVLALGVLVWPFPINADHVKVGVPISTFLLCDNEENAYVAIKHLTDNKPFNVYADWLTSTDGSCIDTRSVGLAGIEFIPVQKLEGKAFTAGDALLQLWWGDVGNKSWFSWAEHKHTTL